MSDEPRDWRDERIAELEAENERLRRRAEYADELEARLSEALDRIAELERRLGLSSQNSSKPPSSDSRKQRKRRRRKKPSGRSPGGQPGHEGHRRKLVPHDEVDDFRLYLPSNCAECGLELSADQQTRAPMRHQVFELVEKPVKCTEHQVASCQCPGCGHTTRGKLPDEVATSGWGARLTALVATLAAVTRDSRRQTDWFLEHVLGAPSSVGTVHAHLLEVSESLKPAFEQIRAGLDGVDVIGVDETGWRLGQLPYWVWVVVGESGAIYRIRSRRTKRTAKEVVGEIGDRIVVTDRYGAYSFIPADRRQICHAHLLRQFTAMKARDGPVGVMGKQLERLSREMQWQYDRVKNKERTRKGFVHWVKHAVRPRWEQLLGEANATDDAPSVVRWLLEKKHLDLAWTFLDHRGVEPTNNAAERALRGPVIHRKLSWGSKSEDGLRLMERLWSVVETCRKRSLEVLDHISEAVEAFRTSQPAPVLSPG